MKLITLLTLTATFALVVRAEELDEATKARLAKAEAGASTIDVSSYPKKLQEIYPTFVEKCASCHKISRGINSDYVLPDEWERYVKRMMRKPGSGMDKASSKLIYDFLVYDSATRKKDAFQEKLKSLPEAERKAAEDKVKEVTEKYK